MVRLSKRLWKLHEVFIRCSFCNKGQPKKEFAYIWFSSTGNRSKCKKCHNNGNTAK